MAKNSTILSSVWSTT